MSQPKISVIIPHYEGLKGVEEALEECLLSIEDQYDELLVVRNDGIGYGPAVNKGLSAATGDYLIVMNNDLKVVHGTIKDLSGNPHEIVVPLIWPPPRDYNPRSIFCMGRDIYHIMIEEGYYFFDERFEMGYFEDDDLIRRLDNANIKTVTINTVIVNHKNGGGLTMKQVGEQKYFDINKNNYQNKWKPKNISNRLFP